MESSALTFWEPCYPIESIEGGGTEMFQLLSASAPPIMTSAAQQ